MLNASEAFRRWLSEPGADVAQELRGLDLGVRLREDMSAVGSIDAIAKVLRNASVEVASQLTQQDIATLYRCLDVTTLGSQDTTADVRNLCSRAVNVAERCPDMPQPAAICVYPVFAGTAREALADSGIKLAVVEDAFPHGQSSIEARAHGVALAVREGAQEVDMVIRRGLVLEGNLEAIGAEVAALRAASGEAMLKVILNTGELSRDPANLLERYRNIRAVSLACIENGAQMIKTSTGKEGQAASIGDSIVMFDAIAHSGAHCGFKAAGGVKTPEDAVAYYLLAVLHSRSAQTVSNATFRIGASSLAGELEKRYNSLPV